MRTTAEKLLADMKGVPPRRRAAQFRCVLALVAAGIAPILEEGESVAA